jgi:hypothetical protein
MLLISTRQSHACGYSDTTSTTKRAGARELDPRAVDRATRYAVSATFQYRPSFSANAAIRLSCLLATMRRMELGGFKMRSLGVSSVRHLLPSAFGIIAPLIGMIWLLLR